MPCNRRYGISCTSTGAAFTLPPPSFCQSPEQVKGCGFVDTTAFELLDG